MKDCGVVGAKALASMLLMHVPLKTLNLGRKLDMILKEQRNDETHDCVVQITRSVMKEQGY